MKRTARMAAFLLLFTAACDSGSNSGGSNSGGESKAGDKSAAAKPLTDEEVDSADIPVVEDFEEEANKEITEDNLEDEIAALEKEIDGDAE